MRIRINTGSHARLLGWRRNAGLAAVVLVAGLALLVSGATAQNNEAKKSPGPTKSLSGKIRKVKDNVLTIQKSGLVSVSEVEVELSESTKRTGEIIPGVHAKIRYREENGRKIVVEISTRPEHASKLAKEAAKQLEEPKVPKKP